MTRLIAWYIFAVLFVAIVSNVLAHFATNPVFHAYLGFLLIILFVVVIILAILVYTEKRSNGR